MNNKILIAAGILGILCIMLISGCTDNTSNKSTDTKKETKPEPFKPIEPETQAENKTPLEQVNQTVPEVETENKTEIETENKNETENATENKTENKTENATQAANKTVTPVTGKKVTPAEEKFNPVFGCSKDRLKLTVGNNNSYDYTQCELMANDIGAAVDKYYFYSKGYTFKITSMYPGNTLDAPQFKSARGDPLNDVIYSYTLACYEGSKSGICV